MDAVGYNQVLNAFIDALPFDKIPAKYKNDTSLTHSAGRDGVCTAVRTMIFEWQNLWNHSAANFDKTKIVRMVENSRDELVRRVEKNQILDEMIINQLLSDMVPEYKDGTYYKLLTEREVFLVTQMSQFLTRMGIPVPEPITLYLSQREGAPR